MKHNVIVNGCTLFGGPRGKIVVFVMPTTLQIVVLLFLSKITQSWYIAETEDPYKSNCKYSIRKTCFNQFGTDSSLETESLYCMSFCFTNQLCITYHNLKEKNQINIIVYIHNLDISGMLYHK